MKKLSIFVLLTLFSVPAFATYYNATQDAQSGRQTAVDNFRQTEVSEKTFLVGANAEGSTIDTHRWTTTVVGSGTATSASGFFTLATGGTANSNVVFTSTTVGRFTPGSVSGFLGGFAFGTVSNTNNIQRFGAFAANGNDGLFFQLNGGVFSICDRNTSVDTCFSSGFSTAPVLDTNFHVWEITYTAGSAEFYEDQVFLFKIKPGQMALFSQFHLGLRAENTNINGNTANNVLLQRGVSISLFGKRPEIPLVAHLTGPNTTTLKTAAGALQNVFINTQATAACTLTIYDSPTASGNVVAVVNLNNSGGNAANVVQSAFGIELQNGLTVVVGTGTNCNAADLTILYE